jgi:hypothetical protein
MLAPMFPACRQNRFIFRRLGGMQMRNVWVVLISFSVAGLTISAQARELKPGDTYMCSWGAGTAARAQELKLSGVSLYAARQKIQAYKFSKPWMRMMAMGITEQTYDSPARIKPAAVKQSFYDDCVKYKLASKREHAREKL